MKPSHTTVLLLGTVFAALFFLSADAVGARHADNNFPKRANFFLSLQLTRDDAITLSQWDLVVLNMEQQILNPELITLMRTRNPHIRILAHVSSQEIVRGLDRSKDIQPLRYKLSQGIAPEWYLHSSSGQRLSWWPQTYLLNVTDRSPRVRDLNWQTYLAQFITNDMLSTGLWDGIFLDNTWDNISYFAGKDIDLDGDGFVDTNIDAAWRAGMEGLFAQIQALAATPVLLVGNNDTTAYGDRLNGMLLENFRGERWVHLMNRYANNAATRKQPQVNIINANTQNTGQRDDYQAMRFGYTSTLLEDGYYSFDFGDQNHGQLWWYDEYDSHLGAPEAPASSRQAATTYKRDVWQRPYDRGLVVVNSTKETQEIALDADYEKLLGTQDPVVNDGSIVRSVTVDGEDGVVLRKLLSTVNDVPFRNGSFARFLRTDGSRARNGFFLFEESRRGGDVIVKRDIDGNGKRDLIVASGPRLFVWRDDGQLYMRVFPYSAQFRGKLSIATGDVTGDGFQEIVVAAEDGYPVPVKIYSRHGQLIGSPWYPFGQTYQRGMSIALHDLDTTPGEEFVVGSQRGGRSYVSIYTNTFARLRSWYPFTADGIGVPSVAVTDPDIGQQPYIIVGSGDGTLPRIRTFDARGNQINTEILPYQTHARTGIRVGTTDIDFDGVDDIVAMSEHVGL